MTCFKTFISFNIAKLNGVNFMVIIENRNTSSQEYQNSRVPNRYNYVIV